jgi:2',3'-cyclic-nucleotide 2'-phosphodiesterase (5'-nucleotidase family)
MANLVIGSPAVEAQKVVDIIDPKTDLIVLLTHNGFDDDLELARSVTGVDVIVGGHSHTRVEPPAVTKSVIVVQAGSNCRNLGRLWLKVENDQVVAHEGKLIPLWADSLTSTPEVAERVQYYQEMLDRELGKVIAQIEDDWTTTETGESPLGKWLTDRLREYGQGDFALVNSGGIRRSLPMGPLTIMNVKEMLPFSNRVVTFQCTGEQLMKIVQNNAGAGGSGGREMLQISGLQYKIVQDDQGMFSATDVFVNGKPIDLNSSYKGVSIDYVVVSQAERYFTFVPDNYEDSGVLFTDMIIEEITKRGEMVKPTDQRIYR